jgi:threonine dehydrogenase-like Zn-dependent dehydrogenase
MEAHGAGALGVMDRLKQAVKLESDRPSVIREMIKCVRKGGTLSILGVYSGSVDSIPLGMAFNKSVTIRMGQVQLHRYKGLLLDLIMAGQLDPSEIISHTLRLDEAPHAYRIFNDKSDHCVKVILKPGKSVNTTN